MKTNSQIYESAAWVVKDWPCSEGTLRRAHFTSGCFDILHVGHVRMLDAIKHDAGTEPVIVGINSDASVTRLKGIDRPIVRQEGRAFMLAALRSVDAVFIFDEDTVVESLMTLRPALWYKGGDRSLETLDRGERKTAEGIGTRIVILPRIGEYSTTGILEKLSYTERGTARVD